MVIGYEVFFGKKERKNIIVDIFYVIVINEID